MSEKTSKIKVLFEKEDNILFIKLEGKVSIYESNKLLPPKHLLNGLSAVSLDLSLVDDFDSYILIYLDKLKIIAQENSAKLEIRGMSKKIESFVNALRAKNAAVNDTKSDKSAFYLYVAEIGDNFRQKAKDIYSFIEFLGELITGLAKLIIKPTGIRWKDFPHHFSKAGVFAVPITVLIVFLIGLISGYQGAVQLAQFGADIFIADLVGISITRELSPLMVAILVAGRSGSAFAAEIGTMKVAEEIDALNSMGYNIISFLVLPRVLAVTLAMPLLTMLCNIAGIGGGLIAALSTLDITISGYLNELQLAVGIGDIVSGLIKSIIFGFLVATIGCYRGLQVTGGAESVGKFTTASVVTGVFLIIFTDAIFTFIFQVLNI
jgi:phospholipid/cholesterol/gamma-HCH transport system permease protein